jgi:hypothetical protein
MYYVGPTAGEQFFLRGLLTAVRGATSFDDLKTVNGIQYPDFKSACVARGLLESDEKWDRTLQEAAVQQTRFQLRWLFAYILLNCRQADSLKLWNDYRQHSSDDCGHLLRTAYPIVNPPNQQAESLALIFFCKLLQDNNSDLYAFHLPLHQHEFALVRTHEQILFYNVTLPFLFFVKGFFAILLALIPIYCICIK